jgi:hypothetical protein
MRFGRHANLFFMAIAAVGAAAARAQACPMCTTNLVNAENAAEAATINTAILFLLAPTLALIAWLIKLVFSYRHYQNEEERPVQQRAAASPEGD